MFLEGGVDDGSQRARSLAVNDADLADIALPTSLEVFGDQIFDLFWLKPMQVEDPVDGVSYHFGFVMHVAQSRITSIPRFARNPRFLTVG